MLQIHQNIFELSEIDKKDKVYNRIVIVIVKSKNSSELPAYEDGHLKWTYSST